MVAQAAIAISLDLTREKDATIEFILCTVWGKSDSLPQWLSSALSFAIVPSRGIDHSKFVFTAY